MSTKCITQASIQGFPWSQNPKQNFSTSLKKQKPPPLLSVSRTPWDLSSIFFYPLHQNMQLQGNQIQTSYGPPSITALVARSISQHKPRTSPDVHALVCMPTWPSHSTNKHHPVSCTTHAHLAPLECCRDHALPCTPYTFSCHDSQSSPHHSPYVSMYVSWSDRLHLQCSLV
jgi:hypothetical protein